MNSFFKKFLRGDLTIWLLFVVLCVASVLIMYSASSFLAYRASSYTKPVLQHATYLAIGIGLAWGIHFIPYKYIRLLAYLGVPVSILLLVLVRFLGVEANDASRWFSLFGIQFQPSEIAKLSLVVVVADFIARIKDGDPDSERVWFRRILVLTGLVCILILLENFSTAVLLFGVVFLMMFIGRVSLKRLGVIVGSLLAAALLGYFVVKVTPRDAMPDMFDRAYTWVARIDRFLAGEEDTEKYVITDETLQPKRAMIAIAHGGVLGVGAGNSIQRDYLPQAYSDFIYAIVIEEYGLVIGVVLMLFYLALLYRAGKIATKCTALFPALLVMGLTLMIVLQAFVSMAVATGLGPVTGQPLPLISRGGTSIVITSVYFGIILGVTRQIKENLQPESEPVAEVPMVGIDEL